MTRPTKRNAEIRPCASFWAGFAWGVVSSFTVPALTKIVAASQSAGARNRAIARMWEQETDSP